MEAQRQRMVEEQLRAGGIADERVLDAMGEVPREEFVPDELRGEAYTDGALPIGHGQTISQPWVVAAICSALELRGDERVLEVGSGSGYSTAVIAELVKPRGRVRSYELVPELAAEARRTLARLGYAAAEVVAGDGGTQNGGRWDAIAVHAAAPVVPITLASTLRPGGRLVVPIDSGRSDVLSVFRRVDQGAGHGVELARTEIAHCRFVPLLGDLGFHSADR